MKLTKDKSMQEYRCADRKLVLNVQKTRKIILNNITFDATKLTTTLSVNDKAVSICNEFIYLGIIIVLA